MSVEKEVIRAIGSDLGETKMDCEHLKRSMNETSVSFFIHEINTWNLSSITKTSFHQYYGCKGQGIWEAPVWY